MGKFEYKVLPAPRRAKRARGVKGEPARFAHAITELMNLEAAEGWEYFKSETLPMEAKTGVFKGRAEMFQTLLIFRRSLETDEGEIVSMTPSALTAPIGGAVPVAAAAAPTEPEPELSEPETPAPSEQRIEPEFTAKEPDMPEAERTETGFRNVDPLKNLVEDHRVKGSE